MRHAWLLALLAARLATAAFAQPSPANTETPAAADITFVSTSDVILLGALGDFTPPEVPTGLDSLTAAFTHAAVTTTLQVEKVLKGKEDRATVPLTFTLSLDVDYDYAADGDMTNPPVVKGWKPDIKPAQHVIIGLRHGPEGLRLLDDSGIRAAADAPALATALAKLPLTMTVTLPTDPVAFRMDPFSQDAVATVHINNTGATPVDLTNIGMESFYRSARVDKDDDPIMVVGANLSPDPLAFMFQHMSLPTGSYLFSPPKPRTLQPSEAIIVTLDFTIAIPKSWKMFAADTLLQTPLALRVWVSGSTKDAQGHAERDYQIAGPWQTILVGFPVPPLQAHEGPLFPAPPPETPANATVEGGRP